MLKVFLVEDEIVVRRGLRKNIKWEELGLICVGEAADGELAYPMIQETQPDILLTDIKMPFMDGLQLSALIKKEMPRIKIIIISGHDDFEYAQKAIGIGVTEFLLKPVSGTLITETVLRVRAEIEKERQQEAFLDRFEFEMQEYEKLKRKQFFREIVGKPQQASELLEKGKQLGLSLGAAAYNIVLFQLFQDSQQPDGYMETLIAIEQEIENSFKAQKRMILFERDLEGYAVLVQDGNGETVEQVTDACMQILKTTVADENNIRYFAAVGLPVQRITELAQSFDALKKLFAHRYLQNANGVQYLGENRQDMPDALVFDGPVNENQELKKPDKKGTEVKNTEDKNLKVKEQEIKSPEGVCESKIDKKILERFLKCAAADETEGFINEYISGMGSGQMEASMLRQYVAMDAFFTVGSFLEELGGNEQEFRARYGEQKTISQAVAGVENLKEYLMNIITEALKTRDAPAAKRYAKILEKVRQFILENYNNDEISLHQAAAIANISPSHFSTIFSQEMGSTFIEYLTNIRMEKAKELLRCSGMKTAEVSGQVGYRDPHYFSYLFKKRIGCTPKEYRQSGNTNQEPT